MISNNLYLEVPALFRVLTKQKKVRDDTNLGDGYFVGWLGFMLELTDYVYSFDLQ